MTQAFDVDYTFGNVKSLQPLTIRSEAGEPTTWSLTTADSPVTSLVGIPLEIAIAKYPGFTPVRALPDARFSSKTSQGTATVTTTDLDTDGIGGRAWFVVLRRSDTKEVLREITWDVGGASDDPTPPTGIALPNTFWAGPSSGTDAGDGAYRHIVPIDVPGISSTFSGLICISAGDSEFSEVTLSGADYDPDTHTLSITGGGGGGSLPSLASGIIPYGQGSTTPGQSQNLKWTNASNTFSIGTATTTSAGILAIGSATGSSTIAAGSTLILTSGGTTALTISGANSVFAGNVSISGTLTNTALTTALAAKASTANPTFTGTVVCGGVSIDGTTGGGTVTAVRGIFAGGISVGDTIECDGAMTVGDGFSLLDGAFSVQVGSLSIGGNTFTFAGGGTVALLASPAFTGTPTVPTAAALTNTTQAASTAFVTAAVATAVTGTLKFQGATNCSTNPNYPAASKGDVYVVSVAGKIGGASGTAVDVGDEYFATADNAGGTQASVGTSWAVLEHNLQGALLSANNLSDVANAATARTNLGLGTGSDVTFNSLAVQDHINMSGNSLNMGGGNVSGAGVITGTSLSLSGAITATTLTGAVVGNASTATALASARTIALSGGVTGSTSFDGSGNVTISATVASVPASALASGTATATLTNLVLVTPACGTPSAIVLTNATGLPVAGGGTGVATGVSYAPVFAGTTNTGAFQFGTAGTAGQVLKSGGAAAKGAYADDLVSVGISIDGGGSAITTGVKGYVNVPYAGTIVSATLVCDVTGSIVIDVWKLAFSTSALPTVSNTITASAKPTISSAKGATDSTLTGWTTTITAGDTFGFNVDSAATVTKATLVLKVRKA